MSIKEYGDTLAQELTKSVGGNYATTAALTALPAAKRANGMMCLVLNDYSLWVFESASVVAASATVLAPDAGTGRWHRLALAAVA